MRNNLLLNLTFDEDFEEKFKTLMSWQVWYSVKDLIVATRDYENALNVIEALTDYLESNRNVYEQILFQRYEKQLLTYHLELLDKTDRWEAYVDFYNQILQEHPLFCVEYRLTRDDPVFNSYIRWTDNKSHHVHFLYLYHHRYEIICRKLDKVKQKKCIGNLYHAKQSSLSEEEIKERYNRAMQWIERSISM